MLKVGICDDDLTNIRSMQKHVRFWAAKNGFSIELNYFHNGEQLLENIKLTGRYDIIFMDIEMKGSSGIETAKIIRESDFYTALILMSQYDKYFQAGYEVHPFYFFSKPINEKSIEEIMDKYMFLQQPAMDIISFKNNRAKRSVNLADVIYFCSDQRKIKIICTDKEYIFYGKLDDVEHLIEHKRFHFVRIHKSFLINMKYIDQYYYEDIVMTGGVKLPISMPYRRLVKEVQMGLLKQT